MIAEQHNGFQFVHKSDYSGEIIIIDVRGQPIDEIIEDAPTINISIDTILEFISPYIKQCKTKGIVLPWDD